MSDETEHRDEQLAVLRREALLPTERSRGLGTVAVVCTMAGVASGLALATTLMAMQVADSMATRHCPYQSQARMMEVRAVPERAFLGVKYSSPRGVSTVLEVVPGSPAAAIALQPGDKILSFNGEALDFHGELSNMVEASSPGTRPTLLVDRDGQLRTIRPTLIAFPTHVYRY